MQNIPQIFHDKEDKPPNFVMYPTDLFAAINNIFSRNEAIVLLTWLGCKGDGSFSPNISYILKMTGINTAENYYRIKKDLTSSVYVEEEDGNIHINTDKIIKAWKNGTTKEDRKKEREESKKKRFKKPPNIVSHL